MSILPSFLYESVLQEAEETVNVMPIPKEYGVDFETGDLTGKIVEGIEALKVWAWNCIKTERYRYAIYSWQYGTEYEQYIGQTISDEYLQNDCYTETQEALTVNPYITGIDDFSAVIDGDRLSVSFTLNTTLGDAEVSISNV